MYYDNDDHRGQGHGGEGAGVWGLARDWEDGIVRALFLYQGVKRGASTLQLTLSEAIRGKSSETAIWPESTGKYATGVQNLHSSFIKLLRIYLNVYGNMVSQIGQSMFSDHHPCSCIELFTHPIKLDP